MPRTFALIPAAGKSTRMGRPKLLLPLGSSTVIEHVIVAAGQAGIEHILVVIAPGQVDLVQTVRSAGADVCELTADTADMRATVERGLGEIESRWHPTSQDDWLLLPADHPTIDPAVVRALLAARTEAPDKSVIVPTANGRRGHPVLLSWKLAAEVAGLPRDSGLNVLIRSHASATLEMPLPASAILDDLDTPEDYARLLR